MKSNGRAGGGGGGGTKLGSKIGFHNFLKFALLVFLDIAQDSSLRQYLTSSRAETSKNVLCHKLGPNRPKSGPKWYFVL